MFFVDKRHCSEFFGIITCFLWIKGTGIITCFLWIKGTVLFFCGVWYYYVFFVDKKHWPEFGIITCFLWIKGTVLSLVLLRVFCG